MKNSKETEATKEVIYTGETYSDVLVNGKKYKVYKESENAYQVYTETGFAGISKSDSKISD